MKKITVLSICFIFLMNFQSNVFADNENNNSEEIIGWSEDILGRSENAENIDLPNVITLDWNARSSEVILIIQNTGFDPIDKFSVTVKTNSYSKSFSISNLEVGVTKRTVPINMEQCLEKIVIDYQASDGGSQIIKNTSTGKREIESVDSSKWHKGSFNTLYESINYHYKTHKVEIGSTNIERYVKSSISFRPTINNKPDKKVSGPTPNVYRWRKNGKYIDLFGSKKTGLIISYGAKE